ncbi:unnamed protein product [Aphanomyces euteiches]
MESKPENRTLFQENSTCKKAEGDTWFRQGNYEKAIICYNKACFVNPDDYLIYSARGNAYAKLCDLKSAIANYKKLLSLMSTPPQSIKEEIAEVFNAQGYSYLVDKEYTTAIVYLTDAVALDALQANYWLHRLYLPKTANLTLCEFADVLPTLALKIGLKLLKISIMQSALMPTTQMFLFFEQSLIGSSS